MTLEIAGLRREVCESCGRVGLVNINRHSPVIEVQDSSSVTVRLDEVEAG